MNYQNDSVRRQDRLLDQPEATELLRRGEYGILCMQRPEGGGYGVPLNYVWDEADAIYIHCAPEGRKLHCLRECDRVTFCIVGKTQVLPARSTKASCSTAGPARGSQRRNVGGPWTI